MPGFGIPSVDFDDFEEFKRLSDQLMAEYYVLVERLVNQHINGWLTWPNFIQLNSKHEGSKLFMRLTKDQGITWCWRMATTVDVALREAMRCILDYHDFDALRVDTAQLRRALTRRVAPLIDDLMSAFIAANLVLVPYIPRGMRLGPALSWPEAFAIRLALCMGTYRRLGQGSPLFGLEPGVLECVAFLLFARPHLSRCLAV